MMNICTKLLRHIKEPVVFFDAELRIIYANPLFESLFGKAASLDELFPKNDILSHLASLKQSQEKKIILFPITSAKTVQARLIDIKDSFVLLFPPDPFTLHRSKDGLTSLLSREAFLNILEAKIKIEKKFALLFLDLNKFKQVNDSYGHDIGDIVLQEVAKRLNKTLRDQDLIGRYGGDEFLILIEESRSEKIATIAKKIYHTINQPFDIADLHLDFLSVSIGIACHPSDASEPLELIKKADEAMFYAKKHHHPFTFYAHLQKGPKADLKKEFIKTLQQKRFHLLFQPICFFDKKEPPIFEGLARWLSVTHGEIQPLTFLQFIKDLNFHRKFDLVVLEKAAQIVQEYELFDYRFSINISPQFFNLTSFRKDMEEFLKRYPFFSGKLILEITENALITNFSQAKEKIKFLHDHSIQFAIDDFGTGYSSLAYILELPVDYLKIDRRFIERLSSNKKLLDLIALLAKTLNAKTIAEGVETKEQLTTLSKLSIDAIQGYSISKPLYPLTLLKKEPCSLLH